jgi:uncharacterized membrane protein YcaP (DUF421 family)
LTDWKRLLLGNAPAGFLLEMLLRLIVVYAALALVIRLFGKRMSGQLTNVDLAVMLLLGAIVGAPLTIPERGLLPALLLLGALVALHWGLNALGARSARLEDVTQGQGTLFLKEGRLNRPELEHCGVSNEQLFSALRAKGVNHLGELKRVYFEANGEYSLIRAPLAKPGLTVQPASDVALQRVLPRDDTARACARCGHVVPAPASHGPCEHCAAEEWSPAIAGAQEQKPAAA